VAPDQRRRVLGTALSPLQTCLGDWKRDGLVFSRGQPTSIVHLIDFQLNKHVDQWTLVVNVGVYSQGVAKLLGWPTDSRVSIGSCQLQARLSELEHGIDVDEWIGLPTKPSAGEWGEQMCKRLESFALPQLATLNTPASIADQWEAQPNNLWFIRANHLVLAAFLYESGRTREAQRLAMRVVLRLAGDRQEAWAKSVLAAVSSAS
jgi:hypothetical protein